MRQLGPLPQGAKEVTTEVSNRVKFSSESWTGDGPAALLTFRAVGRIWFLDGCETEGLNY